MPYKLIRLSDDTLVEVATDEGESQPMASGANLIQSSSLDKIEPIMLKACRAISNTWRTLSEEIKIEKTEVELGLSFEGQGNLYITKAKAGANFTVKLTIKPV